MLARMLERAGVSTVLVTMMPCWAEQYGVPRALAVEFPFAHPLGLPDDVPFQLRVIREAIAVLADAKGPNTIVHSDLAWPGEEREWRRLWQPAAASPIIARHLDQIRAMRPPQPPAG